MAINTLYLDGGILKSANKTYNNQNPKSIRIENFFQKAVFQLLQNKIYNSKFLLKFNPEKYRYFTTKSKEIESFIKGRYFDLIIRNILGIKNYKISYETRRFGPGCYTLLHDTEKEKAGVDFILDFSIHSKKYFGGCTTFLTESEELLQLCPKSNTLSFIGRTFGVMKYTKYFTRQNEYPIVQVVGAILRK